MQNKINKLIQKGIKAPMPGTISPMLCTLLREPFTNKNYVYELKLDGYRIISSVHKSKVIMNSRSGLNYTSKYPPIATALKKLKQSAVLDGEVSVLNEHGHPD